MRVVSETSNKSSYTLWLGTPALLLSFVVLLVAVSTKSDKSGSLEYDDDELYDPLNEQTYPEIQAPYEAFIDIFVRVADPNQPLLQKIDGAMPRKEFDDLQRCLRDHPMRHFNVNDDDTFKGTRGFLLSFSEKGIDNMRADPRFSCLQTYFDRHRLPGANAWVLNMVWADIPDYTRELAIQRHTDDAIMLDYNGSKKVMPFQTNVLYVFVPDDMRGGELEAWNYDVTERELLAGPMGRVRPEENRMAFFRGDAQHQVRSYNTSAKDVLRGSLVLEQYKIPEEYSHMLLDWHWRDREGGEMM